MEWLVMSWRGYSFIIAGTSVSEEVYDAFNLGGIFVEDNPEVSQLVPIRRKFRSFEAHPWRSLTLTRQIKQAEKSQLGASQYFFLFYEDKQIHKMKFYSYFRTKTKLLFYPVPACCRLLCESFSRDTIAK